MSKKDDAPRSSTGPRTRRSPTRRLALAVGAAAIVAVTAFLTVAVEHRLHGTDDHDHDHGEHEEREEHPAAVELSEQQIASAGLKTRQAGPGKVVVTLDLPGEVVPNAEAMAHVGPRVSGTVREVKKKLGDEVKEGDVLALLDSRDVAEMQGEIEAARERVKLTEATLERKRKLYEEKITSEREYLEAKQAHAEALVQLRSRERSLAAKAGSGNRGGGYALLAPLSGTIVEWHIGLGEVLEENARAFTIADLSTIWVNVTVYPKDLSEVHVGQRALVRAEGIEDAIEGRIAYVSETVAKITRSATARLELERPGPAWRPGLFVTAEVEIAEAESPLVIAEGAVQTIDEETVVFVRDGKSFEARPVRLGRHGHDAKGERVHEVLAGLNKGELYVIEGSFLLKAELGKASAGHAH